MHLLSNADEARRVKNHMKAYFLMEKMLWKRNGTKPPLQVILHPDQCLNLTKQAHDESGHCGKDPMYKKLSDSYWCQINISMLQIIVVLVMNVKCIRDTGTRFLLN